ncbi:uncharacterized protein LOC124711716 [Schistocerca piceifrons]|uniref:uncharacterized protein LOC124711716 n=1 Tax=Schistocerca piceifrons TaxID=274613 RepID=UPI001F5E7F9F|nr:uncharacterized protein LOC124711716 [Schistocerca piceifrons]
MKTSGRSCSLLLLTMAVVSSGRNARDYFDESGFQYSPSRPEDSLVFFIANVPPIICESKNGECDRGGHSTFCVALPRGYSPYTCWFEGNATVDTNLNLIGDNLPYLFNFINGWLRIFTHIEMHCTTSSQLPDEYFQLRVQRPNEDRPVKCRFLHDNGRLYLRFPGYPTIVCQTGTKAGRFDFKLPIIDDPLKCSFRVYSELLLGDTRTEECLYQSLISGLPRHMYGSPPRVVCSQQATSKQTAHFQLLLQSGSTYDCGFPDAVPRYLPQPENTPRD